ncbi:hypothetical protein [Ktedonobacter robiniae]|uniref:DUF3592 domain-containing protein n=1 Tax=Ktedonobacter robiniae TaxID=2778365 RepID=A0ABQ3UVD8_9CHLR|nr:hypothetical protein [Ktedonobacter robiniae]GHO56641.1 hypothetical protein KSB_51160 [Ktedonobacter robiniae]
MSQDLLILLVLAGIVLLGFLIYIGIQVYRSRWYKTHGKEVIATVVDIEERERVYNRRIYTKYKVYAHWKDPLTDLSYDYESRWVYNLPRVLYPGKSKVNVYIQPDEPEKYLFKL